MRSLERSFLEQMAVPLEMAGTLRVLGEFRGRQDLFEKQVPQVLNTLKQVAMVQSTESSNRIEGIIVADDRIQDLVAGKATPRDRAEAEVAGYRDVLARIHASPDRYTISPETILTMHGEMLRHTDLPAGQWKRRDNLIEQRLPDGRWVTRFVPVPARNTPYQMDELCERFNRLSDEGRIDRVLLIHAFILDFLCIHPFTDGNGRVSRLLTVLMLHQAGYQVGRFISLERLIEESKETYYEALGRSSEGWHHGRHRPLPWWEYSLGILIAAYKEFEARVGMVRASRGAKTAWVRDAVERLPSEFAASEVARLCPEVSRPMIRMVLEALRAEGKLSTFGSGRAARWRKRDSDAET